MHNLDIIVLRIKNEELSDIDEVKGKIESALGFSFFPSLQAERGSGGE